MLLIVRLLIVGLELTFIETLEAITTSWALVGTTPNDQLVPVFQLVLVAPVQVFVWQNEAIGNSNTIDKGNAFFLKNVKSLIVSIKGYKKISPSEEIDFGTDSSKDSGDSDLRKL
ncbi:MAG: hypothetical protein JNM19_04400 [Chitinophagaceae bacterium]|nr:hypothetical protein [Chitinophagaceae bacterium]